MNDFRYILQPYKGPASRGKCPACGKTREFARYVDITTGALLPDNVGRCNREQHCGYHYTPKQYFADSGQKPEVNQYTSAQHVEEPAKPVDFLPVGFIEMSAKHSFYERNNFFLFLQSLFTKNIALDLCTRYLIGTSNHWQGATIFWQVDRDGQCRQCKIMLYNPVTGKRVKRGAEVLKYDKQQKQYMAVTTEQDCTKVFGKYLDETTKELNLHQCFFGEHLLTEYPEKTVAIVESEKTAVIASVYFPSLVWMATGGKFGCKWSDYAVNKVLKNRKVILFPDLGAYDDWSSKPEHIQWQVSCKIVVSDLLEKAATDEQRANGWDLADYLLTRDETTGLALKDGYPAIFDYKN